MFRRITSSGDLIVVPDRTAHDEIMILCARMGYNP